MYVHNFLGKFLQTNVKKFLRSVSRSSSACNALNFFSRSVKSAASIAKEQPCEDARLWGGSLIEPCTIVPGAEKISNRCKNRLNVIRLHWKYSANLKQGAHIHQPTAKPTPHAWAQQYHAGSGSYRQLFRPCSGPTSVAKPLSYWTGETRVSKSHSAEVSAN